MIARGEVLCATIAALTAAGCVGPRWKPVVQPPGPFIALPDGAPVAGLGAKVSARGLIPKRCLSEPKSETSPGTFDVEARLVDGPLRSGDRAADAFVESSARRAELARPERDGPPPVGALLTVRSGGQWTTLEERTAKLSEETNRLLGTGRYWEFFERCGTQYVHAARREPSALIYLALYPATPAQRVEWAKRIAERTSDAPHDLVTVQMLDRLIHEAGPAFLAVRADADETFQVVDPRRGAVRSAGRTLAHALRASFGTDRGRIAGVTLRPWSSLPAAAPLLEDPRAPENAEPGRRERLFQQLKLLESRALDRETLLAQAAEVGGSTAGSCKAALEKELKPFRWDAYYRCRDAARDGLPARLLDVADCRPVIEALDRDALPASCERLGLDDGRFGDPRKRIDTRYPLLLEVSASVGAGAGDHLFEDAQQLAEVTAPGGLGAQTDRRGEAFSPACFERSESPAAAPGVPGESAPSPRPWNQDAWDGLARSKKPPAPAPAAPPPPKKEEAPLCIEPRSGQRGEPLCLHPKEESAGKPSPEGAEQPEAAKPQEPPKPQESTKPPEDSKPPEALEPPPQPQPPGAQAAGAPSTGGKREVILGISANQRHEGERQWPWWRRLLSPGRAPEPRPIYRGAYELRTLHGGEPEEISLTDAAAELAKKDLPAFYRACGTHRVRQVVQRKGVAYHFSTGSPDDLEISVLPYGVPRKAAESEALRPEQAQGFLADQSGWQDQLSEQSEAIPQHLVLEPWSELLLEAGVVQPHQLSPGSAR